MCHVWQCVILGQQLLFPAGLKNVQDTFSGLDINLAVGDQRRSPYIREVIMAPQPLAGVRLNTAQKTWSIRRKHKAIVDGNCRQAVVKLLPVQPPQLRRLGDISTSPRINATQRSRPGARLRLSDAYIHAIAHKHRGGHEIERRLWLSAGPNFFMRLAVELPEQFAGGRFKTVEPAVTTWKRDLGLARHDAVSRRAPL